MSDTLTLTVLAIIVGLGAAWWALIRRRPRKPKPTSAGFTRMEG